MRKHFEIISAAITLSMVLGCSTYIRPVYADESTIPNADLAPAADAEENDNGVKVSVKEEGQTESNSINPTFTITNTSDKEMNLEDLNIKYYYTADGEQDQTFNCYYAGTVDGNYQALTSYVQGKVVKMDKAAENADSYMEVTFNGGTLEAGQSAMIQTSVNKSDWSNYEKDNDYSYDKAENIEVSLKGITDTDRSEVEETLNITSDEVSGRVGDSITIPVKISGLSKENDLCGGVFKLQYDTDVLEDVAVIAGPMCSQGTFSKRINKTTGVISILFADDTGEGLDDITEDGVFFTIQAKVKDSAQPGNYKLKLYDEGSFQDKDDNDYKPQFNFGEMYIHGRPVAKYVNVETDSIRARSGDTITVPVKFKPIGLRDINECDFKFKYNTDIFENVSISAGEICPNAKETFSSNVDSSTGIISGKFSGSREDGTEYLSSNDGVFMYITLKVKDNIDSVDTSLKEESGEVSSVYYGDCYPSYNLGKISINNSTYGDEDVSVEYKDVEGKAGETITVPINIKFDTKEHDLPAAQIVLSYDKDIFEDVDAEAGEICKSPQENFYCEKDEDKGTVNIMYMASDLEGGSEYLYDNGVLAYVKLKIKDDCSASETQLKADFSTFIDDDLSVISSKFYPGKITIAKEVQKPEVIDSNRTVDKYMPENINFTMNLNGNEFVGIKGLKNGVDYTVSDNVVTLNTNFLNSLPLGCNILEFIFSSGETVAVKISILGVYHPVIVTSDNVEGYSGERISIPIKFSGLSEYDHKLSQCFFRLQYDTDVLEDVTVTRGNISPNKNNFASKVDSDTGTISAFYAYGDEPEYITEDGVFITISATVKDGAGIGRYGLKVSDHSGFIGENDEEYDAGFNLGSINVIPVPAPAPEAGLQ